MRNEVFYESFKGILDESIHRSIEGKNSIYQLLFFEHVKCNWVCIIFEKWHYDITTTLFYVPFLGSYHDKTNFKSIDWTIGLAFFVFSLNLLIFFPIQVKNIQTILLHFSEKWVWHLKITRTVPAVQSLASSSYPSEQSGAPSHKYWIEIHRPSEGHRNGSNASHLCSAKKK